MNREEIIRMAREVSNTPIDHHATPELFGVSQIERFAALVAAAEREKVARWQIGSGYSTGHGDTIEDLLVELEWQIREAEREACAKVLDEMAIQDKWTNYYGIAAAAIRARGEK